MQYLSYCLKIDNHDSRASELDWRLPSRTGRRGQDRHNKCLGAFKAVEVSCFETKDETLSNGLHFITFSIGFSKKIGEEKSTKQKAQSNRHSHPRLYH